MVKSQKKSKERAVNKKYSYRRSSCNSDTIWIRCEKSLVMLSDHLPGGIQTYSICLSPCTCSAPDAPWTQLCRNIEEEERLITDTGIIKEYLLHPPQNCYCPTYSDQIQCPRLLPQHTAGSSHAGDAGVHEALHSAGLPPPFQGEGGQAQH